MPLTKPVFWLGATAALWLPVAAEAQSMNTPASAYVNGYGLSRYQLRQGVDPSTRDANGNRVFLDGVMMTGSDQSVYGYSKTYGAGDSYSGAGAYGGATAIGNYLNVTVVGNHNTVFVNSTQINNGDVSATNGKTTNHAQTGGDSTGTSLNGQLNGF